MSKPATVTQLAEYLALSRTAIRDSETAGVFRRGDGLAACCAAYCRHIRARRQNTGDERLKAARAKQIELKTLRDAHELIRMDESLAMVSSLFARLIAHLDSVPSRVTRDPALRQLIDGEITAARNKAAAEMQRQAASLRERGKAAPAVFP